MQKRGELLYKNTLFENNNDFATHSRLKSDVIQCRITLCKREQNSLCFSGVAIKAL